MRLTRLACWLLGHTFTTSRDDAGRHTARCTHCTRKVCRTL